jgi:hypothetical protein
MTEFNGEERNNRTSKTFNGPPLFENLCLFDLSPTSRSDLQLVASGGDEELFRATAKMVVELQDNGGANPFLVTEVLAENCPSLVAKYGEEAIEQMAKLIFASEIPSLSNLFQSLFDRFNQKYFSGAVDRYQVHVVFDIHTVANEPIDLDCGPVYSGLTCVEERRIYMRYEDEDQMQDMLIYMMAWAASGGHDERLRAEMVRLKMAGAPFSPRILEPRF